jgi:site-specific DNA-methyltransferase (adenine-specific)
MVREENRIVCGDCVSGMKKMNDGSVQLTVTSPPYDIGKDYGEDHDDRQGIESWKLFMEDVIEQLFRITKPDGKVVFNVGKSFSDSDKDGRFYFYPLAAYIKTMMVDAGFDFWDEIIWNKNSFASRGGGALMGSYPYPSNFMVTQRHEHVLVFRKYVDNSYHKSRNLPQLGTEKRERSALTKDRWNEITQSMWDIAGVTQSNMELDHGAVSPVELSRRAVQLYSFVGDTIFNPMMGSGTVAVAAKELDRNYYGFEQNQEYVEYARNRVGDVERGSEIEYRESAVEKLDE